MAYQNESKQLGKFRITALIIVAAVLLILALVVHGRKPSSAAIDPTISNQPSSSRMSPDRVKAQAGANNDTMPSPTGTGPGSDRSLLGQ